MYNLNIFRKNKEVCYLLFALKKLRNCYTQKKNYYNCECVSLKREAKVQLGVLVNIF